MVIQVIVQRGEQTIINPDPAIVSVHEHVAWQLLLRPGSNVDAIEWTVYFQGPDPFRGEPRGPLRVRTRATSAGTHLGVLNAGPVQDPGDYKYGVRADIAGTNQALSDDDPYLLVRS